MYEVNLRLAELLAPWTELFDQVLTDEPVHGRPIQVAMMLVSEQVVTTSASDDNDFLEQDWFGSVVAATTSWYVSKYGSDLLNAPESTVRAAVLVYGSIFQVLVPTNPNRPGDRPGTAIIYFTSSLLADEDPLDWIRNPPVLGELDEEQASSLKSDLIAVCNRTRSIVNGLAGADFGEERIQPLSASIISHIDSAIRGFCEGGSAGKQFAVWELHLAVEKALKVVIRQRGTMPPNIHDLQKLNCLVSDPGIGVDCTDIIAMLPTSRDAIMYRYGELSAPTVRVFYQWYIVALEIIDLCVNAVPRGYFSKHDSLTIQALPWHPSRRKDK